MRVAVCISGQQRKSSISLDELNSRMKFAFQDFDTDYFYHTWENCVLSNKYENMIIEPEPIIDYSPIKDTITYAGEYFDIKRKTYKKGDKLDNATKQILAHNSLMAKIDKGYDVIVRGRWDLYFSNKLDYQPFLKRAIKAGPVGLGFPKWDRKILDSPTRYEKTRENKRWWKMISPDNLIMHAPNIWNVDKVNSLHQKRELLPAEWGWYQILCSINEDSHTGYRGGAITLAPGNKKLKLS